MTKVNSTEKKLNSPAIHPLVERFRPNVSYSYREYDVPGRWRTFNAYNTSIETSKLRDNLRHVTPQERFDAFLQEQKRQKQQQQEETQNPEGYASRCTSDGTIYATFNTSAYFEVEELVYPGNEAVPVVDKWIYAVHTGSSKIIAEIYAVSKTEMYRRDNPTFQAASEPLPNIKMTEGKIQLPMISACDVGTDIGFFITPFRLTKEAADFLTGDNRQLKETVVCAIRKSVELLYVAVPDPYQWAEDTHAKFFAPLLNHWQSFVLDPLRQARLFIASAVKSALEAEQIRTIQKMISLKDGEPKNFLSTYKRDEEKLRITAEVAAAYFYNCWDSPEHQTVELSGIYADNETLSLDFTHWAILSDRLIETAQGRRFANSVAEQPNRLPTKFLFPDQSDGSVAGRLKDMFPNTRYGWQAGIAIVGEWVPAHFARARGVDPLRKIINALDHLGIKDGGKAFAPKKFKAMYKGSQKITKLMYKNLSQMVEDADSLIPTRTPTTLTAGATKYEAKLIEDFVDKISNMDMTQRVKRTQPGFMARSADRLNGVYEKYFDKVLLPLSVVIETINTINSVKDIMDNKDPDETLFKWINMVGSTGDFMSVLAAPVSKYAEKQGAKAAAKASADAARYSAAAADVNVMPAVREVAGDMALKSEAAATSAAMWGTRVQIAFGVIGMVAGTCQMIDEMKQTGEAWKKREYGMGVGHGIAAFGAGLTVVGGGLSVAALIAGGAKGAVLGPAGVVVAVVGTVLIFAGNIIASILTPNAFEQFAKYCFLGDDHGIETKVKLDWAEGELPTWDIYQECRELLRILCSFQLELEETFKEYHKPSTKIPNRYQVSRLANQLNIRVGYLTPSAEMDIVIEQTYKYGEQTEKVEAHLKLLPQSNKISYVRGEDVLQEEGNIISRDGSGAIDRIHLNLKPLKTPFNIAAQEKPKAVSGAQEQSFWRMPSSDPGPELPKAVNCLVKVRASMGDEGVYIPSQFQYTMIETTNDEVQSKINERIFKPNPIVIKDKYGRVAESGPKNKVVSSLDAEAKSN